jgi:hypothetical protein
MPSNPVTILKELKINGVGRFETGLKWQKVASTLKVIKFNKKINKGQTTF